MVREIISLVCTDCKRRNYTTTKNKKKQTEKVALRKYCSHCNKHVSHKEGKV